MEGRRQRIWYKAHSAPFWRGNLTGTPLGVTHVPGDRRGGGYRAALYIRLSREDETDGPSESVSNQRAMLEDFARQRGVPVAGLYVDDTAILGLKSELQ